MEKSSPAVLVIDDDPGIRKSLSRLICSAGWQARTFSSAQEFLDCQPPPEGDCLLLDIQMPGLNGPQLHESLASAGISLPVVFVTGHGDVPTSVQAMKRGAVDFLLKPVDDEVLLATVRGAIDAHLANRAREIQQEEIKGRCACLTAREREVMGHVISGRLNKQIAADLGISVKTVKVHRARAMEKMGVRTVAALIHACAAAGIGASVS